MEHIHYDVQAAAGATIRVELDQQANVLLLDGLNYPRYCRGDSFHYHGGLQRVSPAFIKVPHAGHWHVAIDLGGASGYVRSAVTVLG